jgi:LysM repeat protein
MSRKILAQASILILCLLAFFGTPASVQAGGVCGGMYYAEAGDTFETIAQRCGTTVSAIAAANPGVSKWLTTGQALFVPGPDYYCNCPPANPLRTYTVQHGDTFALIASRFRVSIYELWAVNPQIPDINVLYVGQVLYLPDSAWIEITEPYPQTPDHLSYGTAPGAPKATVKLSNKAKADVYVSLQGTTPDGATVINEYTVNGTMNVKVPAGKYEYVAWVGGRSFSGQFGLPKGSGKTITFYKDKVVAE